VRHNHTNDRLVTVGTSKRESEEQKDTQAKRRAPPGKGRPKTKQKKGELGPAQPPASREGEKTNSKRRRKKKKEKDRAGEQKIPCKDGDPSMHVVENTASTAASKQRSAQLEAIKTGKKRVRVQQQDEESQDGLIDGSLPLTSTTACFSEKLAIQLQQIGHARTFHEDNESNLIDTLTGALDQLESTLYETIVAYYEDVLNAYKHCLPLDADFALLTQATYRSKEVVASHQTTLLPRLAKWSEMAEALTMLYRTHQELQASIDLLETGQIVRAAAAIHEANQCMIWFATEKHAIHEKMIDLLQEEVMDRKAKLRTRLNDLYDAAMTIDVNKVPQKGIIDAALTIQHHFNRNLLFVFFFFAF